MSSPKAKVDWAPTRLRLSSLLACNLAERAFGCTHTTRDKMMNKINDDDDDEMNSQNLSRLSPHVQLLLSFHRVSSPPLPRRRPCTFCTQKRRGLLCEI